MTTEHTWAIGDWCEFDKKRSLVFRIGGDLLNCVDQDGEVSYLDPRSAKCLPECTGWDWKPPKPIEPPPGYRLVKEGQIEEGDMSLQDAGWYFSNSLGSDIAELIELGAAKAYARKIPPQYRPFANAAEYESHRNKWVRWKGDESLLMRIACYNSANIWLASALTGHSYNYAHENLVFEDGTPFGVPVDSK